MNTFLDQEIISRDMHPSSTLTLTVLCATVVGGLYLYDLIKKSKTYDENLGALGQTVRDMTTLYEAHTDTLDEHDERIREKKDYDDSEEIEEGKHQTWRGAYMGDTVQVNLIIWRVKESSIKKNQDWISWNGVRDSSCIVRDFYLGNSNPDFSWSLETTTGAVYKATVTDTMINGWDSIIKLELTIVSTKENALDFTQTTSFNDSDTFNSILKKVVDQNLIQWSRGLVSM
jgi:hypothetical protein